MPPITPTDLADAFDAHAPALVLYARTWLDAPGAEDVVQEVFLRLAALGDRPQSLRAWLLTCVRNAALDTLRGTRRRAAHARAVAEHRLFAFTPPESRDALDPEEVQAALKALAPTEREIITLRIWNSATFEEIAAILGLPLSSLYAKYQAGLHTMRARWEEPCRKT
jgi:RNA polymerase sigma-70 factor (ECF subfamily)